MYVYLISRICPSSHRHNAAVADMITGTITGKSNNSTQNSVFIPHENNPCDVNHDQLSHEVFKIDLDAMNLSDCGCVAFPVRSDCSAEIGWYHGNDKPVHGIIVDTGHGESCSAQYAQLKDNWMVKGFLTSVIVVGCSKTFECCLSDPILVGKTTFVKNPATVNAYIQGIQK